MRSNTPPDAAAGTAALRRLPAVRALRAIARQRGIEAWIVGGAVRDRALGLEPEEIDVAVERDAEGLARALEAGGAGRAVFLSRGRPGPRVFRVAGKRNLDIAELEGGSIGADLGRRDFTVNAVAVPLGGGAAVDPFGGLPDLARGRLRCVHARNMLEDPLRALRAARFIATHRLRPDRATLVAARRAAPRMAGVARERIGAELGKLLASEATAPALSWAARAGILHLALGLSLPAASGAALARWMAKCDDRTTRSLQPERRRRLRLAMAAVGMGLSEVAARGWLRTLRWPRAETEGVARLGGLAESAIRTRSRRDAWRWILQAGDLAPDALLLLRRLGPAAARRAARLRPLASRPVRRVRVTGDDIVRWLDVAPGPVVGRLLEAVRIESAMGTVKNRREARNWLSGQVRTGP